VRRAFALAYYFHPDKRSASQITTQAMAKVALAARVQARRIYYRPKGRSLGAGNGSRPSRTKVSVDRVQLLQRLVLLECDLLDRRHENLRGPAEMSAEQFVLRFVRQAVWCSSRRSSLYVATALGRILHGYSTAEVLGLFSVVLQDPERAPDDSYVRSVKQALHGEFKHRFGDLLRTRIGPRGEEVFETVEPSARLRRLVDSCLERLTPWNTSCPVPEGFDAFAQSLRPLRSAGGDPEAEHPIEVRRMHSLIHPDCLARLVRGLGLRSPAEVLRVPKLFRPESGGPSDGGAAEPVDRTDPPPLSDRELDGMGSARADAIASGDDHAFTHLSLRVDGHERARLPLAPGALARFGTSPAEEVLEIVGIGAGRETPLALHLLGQEPPWGPPADEELVVAAGWRWRIHVLLRPSHPWTAGCSIRQVEATCRRGSLLDGLGRTILRGGSGGAPTVRWAVAAPVLAVALVAAWLAGGLRPPAPSALGAPVAVSPPPPAEAVTRGQPRAGAPATLETARSIYVESLEGADGSRVTSLLARALETSGRFEVADRPETADLAFKGTVEGGGATPAPSGPERFRLELRLVDAGGRTLWTTMASGASWEEAVGQAMEALLRPAPALAPSPGRQPPRAGRAGHE
jgi:hypothetical protein